MTMRPSALLAVVSVGATICDPAHAVQTSGQNLASAPTEVPARPSTAKEYVEQLDANATKAYSAWRSKKNACEDATRFLATIDSAAAGAEHSNNDQYRRDHDFVKEQKDKQCEEAAKAELTAIEARRLADRSKSLLDSSLREGQALAELKKEAPRTASCILHSDEFDPSECLKEPKSRSQGALSLPGRVVDRKGATATIAVSGDASKASLRVADIHNLPAWRTRTEDFEQARRTIGYNFGIQTTSITKDGGRLAGLAERSDSRSLTELDRLDEKGSFFAGVSFNQFPKRRPMVDIKRLEAAAQAACQAENPNDTSACEETRIINWIRANPEHLEAFRELFWATGQRVAEWGIGFQGEIARPVFRYFPFKTVTVVDPFNPEANKTVLDLSDLPAGFPTKPVTEAKLPFTLTTYGFRHFPLSRWNNQGVTLIGSGTFKRAYDITKSRKDVIICPETPDGPSSNEGCVTINAAAPEGLNEYLLSAEARTLFGKAWIFPGLGFSPKFTLELKRGRRSLDVPFYFAAGKEGVLNGGLRFKWDFDGQDVFGFERKNELLLSIFFATNFDFIPYR